MGTLFVYIDESGNFDFSVTGTKYYIITSVITHNPLCAAEKLGELRLKLLCREVHPTLSNSYLEKNIVRGFHATEDQQVVRDDVFSIIKSLEHTIAVNAIVVQKNKANPSIREAGYFYSKMASYLLKHIKTRYRYSDLCILFSGTPTCKQKALFKAAILKSITELDISKPYRIYFPEPNDDRFLDVSDYASWAIYRKWQDGDERSYNLIKEQLGTPELDIFKNGETIYY